MADAEASSAAILRLINGYQVSQAIHVAAALGLADELAEGPRAIGELASVTATDEGALHRLLRALAAVEVLREQDDGTFALTALGEALRGPAGSWAAFIGRPPHWASWGHLLHSVHMGESGFRAVHGVDVWEYRASRPDEAAAFDAAMTGLSRRVDAAVAAAHEGGDAYLLKSVLHDWEDEPAIAILRACRRAARVGTALLVIERQFSLPTTMLSDLNMLVGPGGRERTPEQYAALLAAAGYELLAETPTPIGVSVFEAHAA